MESKKTKWIIGIDEAGRPRSGRASRRRRGSPKAAPRLNKLKYLIGIDEAGRGPLAGPVVVAGIRLRTPATPISNFPASVKASAGRQFSISKQKEEIFKNIRDSKKLTAKQREEWFRRLTNHPRIEWAVAKVWPKVIDRINIAQAANLGVKRVYVRLSSTKPGFSPSKPGLVLEAVLLDGSLKLPLHIPHEVIIKGDEKIPVISAASIVAKVTRDRLMLRLHKKYPQYRFDLHKGYGTKLHQSRMQRFGRSDIHRASFVFRTHFVRHPER